MNLQSRLIRPTPTALSQKEAQSAHSEELPHDDDAAPDIHPPLKIHPEEPAWLERAHQGDLAAFEWLITHYRDRAIRLASHILRRPEEAEDLVQEAFLRAFTGIDSFRGDAAFYTWLYRIVVRLCLNRMRRPFWHQEADAVDLTQVEAPLMPPGSEQHTSRLLIETLMHRLSPPLRAALILREVEGLDYQEIADMLQIPIGTVRSRLSAARSQFRELWQQALKEATDV